MDNQHTKIKGYRETAAVVGALCDRLANVPGIDKRWLAIARTDLQKGFMSLVRSIAKPDSF